MRLTFDQVKRIFQEMYSKDHVILEQGAGIKVSIQDQDSDEDKAEDINFEIDERGNNI